MANDNTVHNTENEDVKEEVSRKQKKSSLLIPIVIGVSILCIGAGAGFYFLKSPTKAKGADEHKKTEEEVNLMEITFLQLPEVIVNLKATKGKSAILKAQFVIELAGLSDKDPVDHIKPLIIDQFQSYLRELETSDLQGAAGLERVRQELQNRVSNLVAPVKIRQILFKDFLIQ